MTDDPKDARGRSLKRPRGFAAMDPAKVKEIAGKGGKAAHAQGRAYEFTSETARAAGRKGGRAVHAKRRASTPAESETPPTIDEKPPVG